MLEPERTHPTGSPIEAASLAAFVDALPPHEVRVIAELREASLAEQLAYGRSPSRPVPRLDLGGPGDAAARVERAISQLARAVAGLWPFLWGGEDFSQARDDALSQAHMPLRLAALAARRPCVSRVWAQS